MAHDDEALMAARMRALAALAPAYFHDLRGPLNTIVLRVGVLHAIGGDADDPARTGSLAAIESEVRRLDGLLTAWLRHTAPASAGTELAVLLRQCVALAAPAARERRGGIELVERLEPVAVCSNPLAVGTAVLQLLRHAVARMHDGGAVIRVAATRQEAQAELTIAGVAWDADVAAETSQLLLGIRGSCGVSPGGDMIVRLPL